MHRQGMTSLKASFPGTPQHCVQVTRHTAGLSCAVPTQQAASASIAMSATATALHSVLYQDVDILRQACSATLCSAPASGEDPSLSIPPLQQGLSTALTAAQSLAARNPPVENAPRLIRRIQCDISFLDRCLSSQQAQGGAAALPVSKVLTPARIQGLINNLRGYSGELLTAQAVPGLVGMGKRFHIIPCAATAAPGSAHEPLLEARRQQQLELKRKQQEWSKELRLSKVHSGPALDPPAVLQPANEEQQQQPFQQQPQTPGSNLQPCEVPLNNPGAKPAREHTSSLQQSTMIDNGMDQNAGSFGNSSLVNDISEQAPAQADWSAVREVTSAGASVGVCQADRDLLMSVEVDLVCQGGSVWLEVKSQERFSLLSEHWSMPSGAGGGGGGRTKASMKGLKRQVEDMLVVAAAPCNAVRWRAPRVGVVFPAGASPDVVAALTGMGALVVEDLSQLESVLPAPPPEPTTTNLDTTTMCALVSEVSWCEAGDLRVAAWAARTSHWRLCVAEQEQKPLLPELDRFLEPGRRLVAADVAVEQFEVLMAGFSGPREQQRWQALKERIEVIPTRGSHAVANVSSRLTCLGTLREVGNQQVAVFGVGDTCQAVTLTANGAAVRSAARQGVILEAVCHRPVWLTGL